MRGMALSTLDQTMEIGTGCLFGIGWELRGDERCAAGCYIAMPGGWFSINQQGWIAGRNDGCAAVAAAWARYLVADSGNTLAFCIGGGCTFYYFPAMTCGIAYNDEWSGHSNSLAKFHFC